MGDVKAVLFDLDHTLYDRDATFLAWARWFVRERLGLTDDSAYSETVDLLVTMDANGYRPRQELFWWIKERYPILEAEVEELVADFYRQHVSYLSLEDDTRLLLDALAAADLPFGIVTNGSVNQLLKIRELGLMLARPASTSRRWWGAGSPEPAIFLAAADELGVAPRDTLFVGDNPEADIVRRGRGRDAHRLAAQGAGLAGPAQGDTPGLLDLLTRRVALGRRCWTCCELVHTPPRPP